MSIVTFPLDNTEYTAAALGSWMATRTRGVFSSESNLAVTPNNNMTVTVSKGLAWLQAGEAWGVSVYMNAPATLTVGTASGTLNRIDAVCLRLNKITNQSELVIKAGTAAVSPAMPALNRDGSYDEIYLATILVMAGAIKIVASDITDTRLNSSVCGLMRDGVTGIPTEQLTAQANALISQLQGDLADVKNQSGLMLKSDYAASGASTVKNAEKLNGQAAGYYLAATGKAADSGKINGVALRVSWNASTGTLAFTL